MAHGDSSRPPPLGPTYPDCFFQAPDPEDPGICIYLDGLSAGIHGDPKRREIDRAIREQLRSNGYEVIEIAASQLGDRAAMARHFYKLAKELMDRDRARRVRDDTAWFEGSD